MDAEDCVDVGYWTRLEDGRIECRLCPRFCKMRPGQRGLCFVRRTREDGAGMELTGYGRSTGFCVDPIEKKPLNHFLPGSAVLSFGTAGCNLACAFCQNWDISKSREVARLSAHATPEMIARAAERLGCASVAYTYNDPVIFMEYALDTAEACRAKGSRMSPSRRASFARSPASACLRRMDAANVDLKAFTERFYAKRCAGALAPVLDTLKYLVHETDVWTEITTLLIPGENDSEDEIEALTRWVGVRAQARRAAPFHRLPPRLSHAGHAADAAGDAAEGALDRDQERASSRLCRQRPRSGAPGDALPDLRRARDRARRLYDHPLRARRDGRVQKLRDEDGGRVRGASRRMGLAAAAGRHRALRGVTRVAPYPSDFEHLIVGAGGDAEHAAERLAELENEEDRAADREGAETERGKGRGVET